MHFDTIQQYCLSKSVVTEEFPFGPETIVWKVLGKMFCLGNIDNFESINLKCDPERALELRESYSQIVPGYHMNKTQWNTVYFDGLAEKFVFELIDHSYNEVVRKLTKKSREILRET
jgi:predicted DNA-binding protein (MmcQ/YjbR family)